MSQEPDEIRQEMDETRCSLTDKISMLEQQVTDTVHEASVGVQETIEKVKVAVQDSVQSVRDTVGETVDSVKETFSITSQVQQRPWVAMAGSVGVGFLAGYMLNAPSGRSQPSAPAPAPRRSGNGLHKEPFIAKAAVSEERESFSSGGGSSVVEQLTKTFEKEINQMKGLAIGTLAGIVRDLVVTAVPEMMRNPLQEVFNDMTTKLGGQMIPGRILSEGWGAATPEKENQQSPPNPYRHPRQSANTPL
ncbi:MAG: hypothetical protein WCL32_06810 [Planctomycetota bacterium]